MNVLLYANGDDHETVERLLKALESEISRSHLEVFLILEDFSRRLRRLPRKADAVVLVPQNNERLLELILLREYLEDVSVILILPNRDCETVSRGLTIYPRFVSFAESNFDDIAAVLGKMLRNMRSKMKKRFDPSNLQYQIIKR